jgi:hypothetical protein
MPATRLAPGGIRYVYEDTATEMPSRAIELRGFLNLVDAVAAAGCPSPAAFVRLRLRFAHLQTTALGGHRHRDRLFDALRNESTSVDTLETLFALALAERAPGASDLLAEIHGEVVHRLRCAYEPAAAAAYDQLAKRFNKTAQAFHAATRPASHHPPQRP